MPGSEKMNAKKGTSASLPATPTYPAPFLQAAEEGGAPARDCEAVTGAVQASGGGRAEQGCPAAEPAGRPRAAEGGAARRGEAAGESPHSPGEGRAACGAGPT